MFPAHVGTEFGMIMIAAKLNGQATVLQATPAEQSTGFLTILEADSAVEFL